MDKELTNKQNTDSTYATSTNNDNQYTNNSEDLRKLSPNKKTLFLESSSLGRHPSGRHLSEQFSTAITDINANCFSGVNVILSSPKNKTNKILYSLSVGQVDNKLYDASDTYYIKNKGKTIQLTPKTQNVKDSVHSVKHNNRLSFTIQQKMIDDKLTQSIQNKAGFDQIEKTISLFHTLKKD